MGTKISEECEQVAIKFEKLGKKIRKRAKKEGLTVICNRSRLFIDGRPKRRWWFADEKTGILVSEEYGLCDDEAVAKLDRFRQV